MADFVQVVVQVDKSQLASLQADVKKLNGQKIQVGVDNKSVDTATQSVKKFGNAAETAAKQSKSLSGALNDYVQWYLRWTVISGAFKAGIASIGKALDTMKAVDAQLVTVRKVTGFTVDEMKRVEEQAYKTASAYGVAADAYLESVAAFARAGYKEQSEALAELSTKTQIVGDTTAETANQFLLSVDAAYKYKGSIEELSKVLDGANEIDNKYATSIEKIAEGMGVVAPVAAQMHVSIGELAAGIGTITAVTQRSGSEAARALRALFLNIAGDTKTEIEEGVTWTTGEIAGLRDVIKLYAKDAYDAAEATKSVINPMKAMEGLAKSMQDGVLTEQKLVEMVSDIGGKLRTSQLLAIIQNWDMYSSMLQDFGNAVGSADKEVENALNSWERKTQRLSDAWAEFISHLIETDEIKGALDVLIGAVEFLDSGFGKFVITVGLVTAAVAGLTAATKALSGTIVVNYLRALAGMIAGNEAAASAVAMLNAELLANPLFWVAGGASLLYGTIKLLDWMTDTFEEQQQKIAKITEQYKAQLSELEALSSKEGDLTGEESLRLAELKKQTAELEKQLKHEKEIALQKWRQSHNNGAPEVYKGAVTFVESIQNARDLRAAINELDKDSDNYKQTLIDLINTYKDEATVYNDAKEAGLSLSESERIILGLYKYLTSELANYTNAAKKTSEVQEQVAESIEETQAPAKTLADLMADAEAALNEEADAATNAAMETQFYALQAALANGQPIDTSSAISSLSGLSAQSTNTAAALQALIAVFQQIENLDAQIESYTQRAAATTGRRGQMYASRMGTLASQRAEFDVAGAFQKAYTEALQNMPSGSGGGGGGGGGRSSSSTEKTPEEILKEEQEAEVQRLKSIISLEEQRLSFLQASGASEIVIADQIRAIQNAYHDAAEYMRSIEWDEEDIVSLSTKWWNAQKNIDKLFQDIADNAEKTREELQKAVEDAYKAFGNEIKAAEEEALAPLEAQLAYLEAQRDARKDAADEAEKLLAITKAQDALDNARNERKIRTYNARTGQWEWVADAQAIVNAEEALRDANQALIEYRKEREIAEIKGQIDTLKSGFSAIKKAADDVASAIASGAIPIANAFSSLMEAIKAAAAPYGINVNGMLGGALGNLKGATGAATDDLLAKMKANSDAWWSATNAGNTELAKFYAGANDALAAGTGMYRDENGYWHMPSGEIAYGGGSAVSGADLFASSAGYDSTLRGMGIVTASQGTYAGHSSTKKYSVGTQYNGNYYDIGGVTMTESKAKSTTIYDAMAQSSRNLALHSKK